MYSHYVHVRQLPLIVTSELSSLAARGAAPQDRTLARQLETARGRAGAVDRRATVRPPEHLNVPLLSESFSWTKTYIYIYLSTGSSSATLSYSERKYGV
ncbi:Hypothetical protein NTJ_12137 [Nesidiocoris tenuis]|uniref:Uncharacterized protein n=1 Tax=Nesidiocoris tenuis TaxID=355587 RepID=A0ABN7B4I2_9HEMI|nr:Hypothetical protein NTJ_12137 [Nesidiocoris tenuis]